MRYAYYYYPLPTQKQAEGINVQKMEPIYLVNAFKKMLKVEKNTNNSSWLEHNLKELEIEILRRLQLIPNFM